VPLLISVFRFAGLEAVILNKAMSLVAVANEQGHSEKEGDD
jgi:hypothetical protein